MIIKGLIDEDFVNYKKPAMYIAFPSCTFKCEKECGKKMCQNSALVTAPSIEIDVDALVNRYINNPITHAVICAGLEPFDTWSYLKRLIVGLRHKTEDDIVIYTGYKEEEIQNQLAYLRPYRNIIVKFGRFIPNQEPHYDEVLGINLASDNQYAKVIS